MGRSSSLLGNAVDKTDAFNQHGEFFTSVESTPAFFAFDAELEHHPQSREATDGVPRSATGTACIFVLPAEERRDQRLDAVREWIARRNDDPVSRPARDASVKVLVIVHRMAGVRLGFADLYSSMNDRAPEAFKNGILDATAWPLRPFISFVMPLSDAIRKGLEFEAMTVLRANCPLLTKEALQGRNVAQVLNELRASSMRLAEMMEPAAGATIRNVLQLVRNAQLVALDPRLLAYPDERPPARVQEEGEDDGEEASREIAAMDAFLRWQNWPGCPRIATAMPTR